MASTLLVVLPIFGLVFAGWLGRRIGIFGPHALAELNRFVVYLALPALLFDIIAEARWSEIWRPDFIAAFGLSCLVLFGLTLTLRLAARRPLADAAIEALNASYANTAFMGLPLALTVFGPEALAPATVATILTVCVVFVLTIVLAEAGVQAEARGLALVLKAGRSLLRNPLVVAPILGVAVPLLGLTLPAPVDTFLKLLGGAASPCALVSIGLFLAVKREPGGRGIGASALLVALKLFLHPLVTWGLCLVLGLPPLLTGVAVLLAALPTGTGPFMLAEFYRRDARITSDVILVSTVLSLATVSACLALIGIRH